MKTSSNEKEMDVSEQKTIMELKTENSRIMRDLEVNYVKQMLLRDNNIFY